MASAWRNAKSPAGLSNRRLGASTFKHIRHAKADDLARSVPKKAAMRSFCLDKLQFDDGGPGAINRCNAAARHGLEGDQGHCTRTAPGRHGGIVHVCPFRPRNDVFGSMCSVPSDGAGIDEARIDDRFRAYGFSGAPIEIELRAMLRPRAA